MVTKKISQIGFFVLAAASCGDIKHETTIKTQDIPPAVVANASSTVVSTDPPVVPISLSQPMNTPVEKILPDPNSSLEPFGFILYKGNPDISDSAYNIIGLDGNPLSSFKDAHYSLDGAGLKSMVESTFEQAFLDDTKQDLEGVLNNSGIQVTDQAVRDLRSRVLRSFYDGAGFDLKQVYLSDPDSGIGSLGDFLFDMHYLVGEVDSQVLVFKNLPKTYDILVSGLKSQEDDAFGGQ